MPEPLKNLYNAAFIKNLCSELTKQFQQFDSKRFTANVFDSDWDNKELKQRMRHITQSLHSCLPDNYTKSLSILKPVSAKFHGLEPMIFPDFVERYGLEKYTASIKALETFTKYSSSEYAVRPFIIEYESKMMKQMQNWSLSKNHHVRRLASEGCRPRLPWAMALPRFKKDPTKVLDIISNLLYDESEYVRRSVANNLNDISKDHPDCVLEITRQHLGKSIDTDRLLKHACRTLLKSGDNKTMELFGYSAPDHITVKNLQLTAAVAIGGALDFSFSIAAKDNTLGRIRIEYAIDFLKANGTTTSKVFKITEFESNDKTRSINKRHSFKVISTRRYYTGTHGLNIIINGEKLCQKKFKLLDNA